jgi:hypothetical protein
MLAIFGREAVSLGYRVRPLRGPVFAEAAASYLDSPDPAGAEFAGAAFSLLDGADARVRLTGVQFDPRTSRVLRPMVQHAALSESEPIPAGSDTVPNYLRWLADRRDRTEDYPGNDRDTILFALARHSAKLADADAVVRLDAQQNVAVSKSVLEPELVDPGLTGGVSPTLGRVLAAPMSTASAGAVDSVLTAGEYLATTPRADVIRLGLPHVLDAFDRGFFVRLALRRLSSRPSALVDRLAREVLNTCSHRLDAWITSYATHVWTGCAPQPRRTPHRGVHVGRGPPSQATAHAGRDTAGG